MKYFKYRAIDHNKNVHVGTLSAKNFEDLIFKLCQKKLYPLEIEGVTKTDDKLSHLKKLKNKLKPDSMEQVVNNDFKESIEENIELSPKLDYTYIMLIICLFGLIVLTIHINS